MCRNNYSITWVSDRTVQPKYWANYAVSMVQETDLLCLWLSIYLCIFFWSECRAATVGAFLDWASKATKKERKRLHATLTHQKPRKSQNQSKLSRLTEAIITIQTVLL
uniref:Uncharacterized protein n=1 Tax=Rhizophora mucronata TaxID=61149 RepID=A0A2P2N077_RHIMU